MKRFLNITYFFRIFGAALIFPSVVFAASGDLDTGFNTDGFAVTDVASGDDFASAVAVDGQGRIVAVGRAWDGANEEFAVVRYNTDGSLDTTFGGDGIVTTSIGPVGDYATAVAIDAGDRIVVAGHEGDGEDGVVVRYNTDGSLDTTFGGDGIVTTSVGNDQEVFHAVAIDASGRIVAAGDSNLLQVLVARYEADGDLDTTFSGDGIVTVDIGGIDHAGGVAIDASGRIVVVGDTHNGAESDFLVLRYNADGTLDTAFGGDGIVTTDISGNDAARGVAIDVGGRIVVAGEKGNNGVVSDDEFAVVRYNADGVLDTTFGGDGIAVTDVDEGRENDAYAVTIDASGLIIAAGFAQDGANKDMVVVRYNTDGSLDTAFGGDGIVRTKIGDSSFGNGIAVDGEGRIAVAGYSITGGESSFMVARLIGSECGNGVHEGVEGCDDGNTTGGDGCNADCGEEIVSDGTEMAAANASVDFDALVAGDTVSLTAPDPRGSEGALVVAAFLRTTKTTDLPETCSCTWSIDPTTLGSYSAATSCDTDLTLSGTGDGTLTVAVDCGIDGSGTFQQAVTVAAASSDSAGGGGGCSLIPR